MTIPYLRQVEVKIGPLEEWRGGGSGSLAISLYGDGGNDTFRISFDVHKHAMSTATPTIIRVYNLSQELRNSVCRGLTQIALHVGWSNTEMILLHTGSVLSVVNFRNGPDIITEFYSNPAWGGMTRNDITLTFTAGEQVKNIVMALASTIEGVTVDPQNIKISEGRVIGSRGYTYAGTISGGLNDLARHYGFNCHVDNGIFYATEHDRFIGGETSLIPVISSAAGNLIKASPMLSSPDQRTIGVSVDSILNPWVRADGLVKLETEMNPQLNGTYKVHTLAHAGDTHGTTWNTSITSFMV